MNPSLLTTKLQVPPLQTDLLHRERLLALLDAGIERRLTLISAPAGAGKTTLLCAWVHHCRVVHPNLRFAWVALDDSDNDIARFLTYVVGAFQHIAPGFGEGLLNAFQTPDPPPLESVLTGLINALATLNKVSQPMKASPTSYILILDDYHVIESPQIHKAVSFLIDHLPAPVHVIISTRSDPPFPLARMRGRNTLMEIRQQALSFTLGEVRAFIQLASELDVDSVAPVLVSRTEGWASGIRIAVTSLKKRQDTSAFLQTFSGSNRYIMDYLVEEVLQQQSEELKTFLLHTAILDRLCGPLCDALTEREDGQGTLIQLEKDNLFVVPLDEQRQWYRYHQLFADLLRRRLKQNHPDLIPELHLRASHWYEEHVLIMPAIHHALASGHGDRAASLIATIAEQVWARGEHGTLLRWLDALTEDKIHTRPKLSAIYALVLFAVGHSHQAEACLETATSQLTTTLPEDDRVLIADRGVLSAARAYIAHAKGDLKGVVIYAQQALTDLPKEALQWRSIALYTLGLAYRLCNRLDIAQQTLQQAADIGLTAEELYVSLLSRLNLAIIQLQRGMLRQGAKTIERALHLAETRGMQHTPVVGLLSAHLGNINVEWNMLEEALPLLKRGVTLCKMARDVNALGLCYTFLMRARMAQGKVKEAKTLLETLIQLSEEAGLPPLLVSWTQVFQIRFYLAQDKIDLAIQVFEQAGMTLTMAKAPSHLTEPYHLASARLLIARGACDKALEHLKPLSQRTRQERRLGRLIEVQILLALAHWGRSKYDTAAESLQQALKMGAPEGYTRIFLEAGSQLVSILTYVAEKPRLPLDATVAQHLEKLRDALAHTHRTDTKSTPGQKTTTPPLIDPLTSRELEVLAMLDSTLSIDEIAQRLVIARSTVRTHVKSIYSKLNVHSRVEAVVTARSMGLLAQKL